MRLLVRLWLLSTAEGGRKGPIQTDYRPDWDKGDRRPDGGIDFHMGRIVRLDVDPLAPGAESGAEIEVFRPEAWTHITPGDQLTCYEGLRAVGHARVLSIVN